ncbi:hypothetical protein [Pelagibius marinus]|uniref:hypothetical protein n=1 Tax=Pelagibius marinus TaxID=2762760 RepID=UPI0018727FCC|nr:hypothetical protein [Pelagibius marinus]
MIDMSLEWSLSGNGSGGSRPATLGERLDAYLRAAGAEDPARRRHLIAATRQLLAERGSDGPAAPARPTWAEIIAAVDACLAAEICTVGPGAQSARGRVALKQGPAVNPQTEDEWGTPPRQRRRMHAQSLSLWRPQFLGDAAWLYRYQISRSTQSLAACLCWLAVLIIP